MIDLKSATTENVDSKPTTPSILMISHKDASMKHEDLITFQKNGINTGSSKGFSKGVLSGSVIINTLNTSKKSEAQNNIPTEETVKVDT